MEHARKMILLPQESVDRLQGLMVSQDPKTVQTPGTPMTRLDEEMSNILTSTSCKNDSAKWALYNQALQRYLTVKDIGNEDKEKFNPREDSGTDQDGDSRESKLEQQMVKDIDTSIVETVPRKWRLKATQLLKRLRMTGEVTWDKRGSVQIDGNTVQGACIVDLINDAMRDRKRPPPAGYSQFVSALRHSNIPRDFIGNTRVLRSINKSSDLSQIDNADLPHNQETPQKTVYDSFGNNSSGESSADRTTKNQRSSTPKSQSWKRLKLSK